MPEKQKDVFGKEKTSQRVQGDRPLFWFFSLLAGTGLFFFLYFVSNLPKAASLMDLFTVTFWQSFGWMCLICFVADYLGKGVAYGLVQLLFRKKPTATFWELNSAGVWTFLIHVFEVVLRAFLFLIGAMSVLRDQLFSNDSLWALVGTYMVLKVCVYVIARLLTGAIL